VIRLTKGVIVAASAVAFVAFGTIAGAQEKKTTTTTTTTPATKVAKEPKAKSACNAITEEKACRADSTCLWIAALVDAKTGTQKRKAYCKTKSSSTKAKEPAKDPKKG
jgi:hypothetical protein